MSVIKIPFSTWENIKWSISGFMCPEKKLIDKLIYDTIYDRIRWTVDKYGEEYLGWIDTADTYGEQYLGKIDKRTLIYILQPDTLLTDGYLCYKAPGKEAQFIRHPYTQRLYPWVRLQIDKNHKKALFEIRQ